MSINFKRGKPLFLTCPIPDGSIPVVLGNRGYSWLDFFSSLARTVKDSQNNSGTSSRSLPPLAAVQISAPGVDAAEPVTASAKMERSTSPGSITTQSKATS